MRDKSGLAIFPNPICGLKNRVGQPCPTRLIREPNDYDNAVISVRRERTFRQCCQEVGSKKGVSARKGTGKHRKNVHFCYLQGRKPLTPMPPAGGSLRGHRPQKGAQVKEYDNACHMRIELTPKRYATLCVKAKKSGMRKRTPIARLLERGEIRLRKFCRETPGTGSQISAQPFCESPGTLEGALCRN